MIFSKHPPFHQLQLHAVYTPCVPDLHPVSALPCLDWLIGPIMSWSPLSLSSVSLLSSVTWQHMNKAVTKVRIKMNPNPMS